MPKDIKTRSDDPWAVDQSVDSDSEKLNPEDGIVKYIKIVRQIPVLGDSLGKISSVLFLIPILIIIIVCLFLFFQESTNCIRIHPFESVGLETDLNGALIAELLKYELQLTSSIDISSDLNSIDLIPFLLNATPTSPSNEKVHYSKYNTNGKVYSPKSDTSEKSHGTSITSTPNLGTSKKPFESRSYSPDNWAKPPDMGTINIGTISFSITDLAWLIQDTFERPDTISGSLKRYGSNIIMIASLKSRKDPSLSMDWEIKRNISADNSTFEDEIPGMVEELAFAIESHLSDPHNEDYKYRNQQTLQNLRNGERSYNRYLKSGNISDLQNAAKLMVLSAESQHNLDRLNSELTNIAFCLAMGNNSDEAKNILLSCRPYYSPQKCDLGLALAFWQEGNYANAITSCDRVLQIEPENVAALVIRGDSLVGSNKTEEGIQDYDNATKYLNASAYDSCTFDASIFCREGYARRYQNQSEALILLDNATNLNRNLSDAWYWKGYIHNELEMYEEAERDLDKATKLEQRNGYYWTEKAFALRRLNKNNEAVRACDQSIQLAPNNSDYWYYKGWILNDIESYTEADQALENATNLDPNITYYWTEKAFAQLRLNRSEEAILACDKSIQLNPKNAYYWYYKGWILNELGEYDKAYWALENATRLDQNEGDYWTEKAFTLLKLDEPDDAIGACDKSIQLNPKNAYYWYYKGCILNELGEYDKAYWALENATRLDQNEGDYWTEKAFTLLKLDKPDDAIQACNQSIQLDPENAYYWYYKAWILNESGRCEEADQALEEAIKLDATYESYRDELICP